jgi:hypothetical protein
VGVDVSHTRKEYRGMYLIKPNVADFQNFRGVGNKCGIKRKSLVKSKLGKWLNWMSQRILE